MQVELPGLITRYSAPNEFDLYPFGTLCRVESDKHLDIYIQRSRDPDNPRWELIESLK